MVNRNLLVIHAKGQGIEIGAYHNPFPICNAMTQVKYVDKWPREKLLEMAAKDPNIKNKTIAPVDIVDDGQWLSKVADNSQDFVLSSHQLEHVQCPLTALENHLRVLKVGGKIIYAIPDKRFTFDQKRDITNFEHLVRDYYRTKNNLYTQNDLIEHYCDYFLHVDHITNESERTKRALEAIAENRDVHFHVWDAKALLEMFNETRDFGFEIELFSRADHENFVILKKL